jgi:hypothetical protein
MNFFQGFQFVGCVAKLGNRTMEESANLKWFRYPEEVQALKIILFALFSPHGMSKDTDPIYQFIKCVMRSCSEYIPALAPHQGIDEIVPTRVPAFVACFFGPAGFEIDSIQSLGLE